MNKLTYKGKKRIWLALLSAVVLLLPGCMSVTVTNISKDQTARVFIAFADRRGYTSTALAPGQSDTDFSGESWYLIRVGGNEEYQRQMKELREIYGKVLTTPGLTSEQVQATMKKIASLKEQEEKARESYARCEGGVENGTVTVTVDWDASKRDYTLVCTEEESKKSE
ncbi:MAG: hypothetical protein M3328_14300 [Chloroflexota bacterium]|nr:hypothetical protein [Chloroflexota bacterium]